MRDAKADAECSGELVAEQAVGLDAGHTRDEGRQVQNGSLRQLGLRLLQAGVEEAALVGARLAEGKAAGRAELDAAGHRVRDDVQEAAGLLVERLALASA